MDCTLGERTEEREQRREKKHQRHNKTLITTSPVQKKNFNNMNSTTPRKVTNYNDPSGPYFPPEENKPPTIFG